MTFPTCPTNGAPATERSHRRQEQRPLRTISKPPVSSSIVSERSGIVCASAKTLGIPREWGRWFDQRRCACSQRLGRPFVTGRDRSLARAREAERSSPKSRGRGREASDRPVSCQHHRPVNVASPSTSRQKARLWHVDANEYL